MQIARETAGAARTRSFPRPLISGGTTKCKTPGRTCREKAKLYRAVIASEAKQSMTLREERMDCFVASLLAMTRLSLQLVPRHAPVGFEIALAGRIDHAGRQRRRRGVAVPAAGFPLG